jgi:dTDP-4-dehydrorhamnose 3,5-epimerase
MDANAPLPMGVALHELTTIGDHRGSIVELDRRSWHPDDTPAQWTLSRSHPCVLRGPHVHRQHADRLVVLDGELVVGLVDLRRDSATAGLRSNFTLVPLHALAIPPGVLHGFFSRTSTTTLNGTSHEYDPTDDFEVRHDDPDLELLWPTQSPVLSVRDRDAATLAVVLEQCAAAGLRVIDTPR